MSYEPYRPRVLDTRARSLYLVAILVSIYLSMTGCSDSEGHMQVEQLYDRDVSQGIHETTPVHHVAELLVIERSGVSYECSKCHSYFTERNRDRALAGEHQDIVFDHGRNVLCLNCHHPRETDEFVAHGGDPIPGDQPTELCGKCHGPHYREWTMGVHGRINGYWNPEMGEQKRLDCIQCHDPHRPKFPKMSADPPPPLSLTRFRDQEKPVVHQGEGDHHE